MSELRFRLQTNTIPVVLEGENGVQTRMTLHEMTAATRDKYLDTLSGRMRLDSSGGMIGVKKFEGLQGSLLVCCLKKEDGSSPTEAEVQAWPASVVAELFKAAQELNKLSRSEGESSKND